MNKDELEALMSLSDNLVKFQNNRVENRKAQIKALLNLLDQGKLKSYLELLFENCPKTEEERQNMMNKLHELVRIWIIHYLYMNSEFNYGYFLI